MKEKPRIFGPTGFGLKDLFVKTTREDIMSLLTTSAISLEKLATVIFLKFDKEKYFLTQQGYFWKFTLKS